MAAIIDIKSSKRILLTLAKKFFSRLIAFCITHFFQSIIKYLIEILSSELLKAKLMKNRCRLDVIVSEFVSVDCYMIRQSVLMNSNGWSRAAKPCRTRPDIVLPWSYFLTWKTLIATFITPSANKWCKNLILSLFRVEVAISKIVFCKIRQKNCYSIYHTNFAYSYSPYNIN